MDPFAIYLFALLFTTAAIFMAGDAYDARKQREAEARAFDLELKLNKLRLHGPDAWDDDSLDNYEHEWLSLRNELDNVRTQSDIRAAYSSKPF